MLTKRAAGLPLGVNRLDQSPFIEFSHDFLGLYLLQPFLANSFVINLLRLLQCHLPSGIGSEYLHVLQFLIIGLFSRQISLYGHQVHIY
jgi:hypothetical protein